MEALEALWKYTRAGGAAMDATTTMSAFHVIQSGYSNTTSTIDIGSAHTATGAAVGSGSASGTAWIGSANGSKYLDGKISEAGIYATAFSSGVQSNARTAYGL
jgi:hypothetical protein